MLRNSGVRLFAAAVALGCGSLVGSVAHAQNNSGWFVPKASQQQPEHAAAHAAQPAPQPVPLPAPPADSEEAQSQTPPVLPLPQIPNSPDLPKGAPPPAPIIGVISVPDVMRLSTAAQQAERVLGARRDELARDAQKEQASWRDEQQKLQGQARTMSSDQIQASERKLQERVIAAQKNFRNRNRIIQEAAQVSLGQIERELVQIIRQVAASRSMNLVLHREQVALSQDNLDITQQVATQLNSILPSVFIPAANVDPEVLAKSGTMPTTADAEQGGASAPAAAATAVAPKAKH
ncbi:OmpH family outer membrane protein [Novacetimonas hansenii]|nr:OmpH family outer membrane protein [Novacetimonas hansenii]MBL7237346.1 OmpH family outer membrane protein [Novacetimonas hansenii]MCJ8353392.1 OmpH family outer membrane protein [Novacetimonas hansenii]PYD73676.1 hypothetical protein CFR74_03130 [Novacetimonas hansenii]QOF94697.1 OmpH family outer membrane protein [Novacetimonas hansenii]RFO99620.1 hypothetical protein BGC30_11900 [Novacetimonas hansenii]